MSDWESIKTPYDILPFSSSSWFFKMTRGWQNKTYIVMTRTLSTENIEHIAICRKDKKIVTWSEKQKIKNELFGSERQAIEIYPKESELIDDHNVYHLWLLPPDNELRVGKYL